MVGNCLDKFFGDEKIWKRVGEEIANTTRIPESPQIQDSGIASCHFRVQVPKPYPGVQYRRSKNLDDRYQRFAENSSIVEGEVEDGGQWLKVSENVYLPMRVGAVQLLEPLAEDQPQRTPAAAQKT